MGATFNLIREQNDKGNELLLWISLENSVQLLLIIKLTIINNNSNYKGKN